MGMRMLATALLIQAGAVAHAHLPDVTSTTVWVLQSGVTITYTVPAADLAALPGERPETIGKPSARHYTTLMASAFRLSDAGRPCRIRLVDSVDLDAIKSFQFRLRAECGGPPRDLRFDYLIAPDTTVQHENLVDVQLGNLERKLVLTAERNSFRIPVESVLTRWNQVLPASLPADAAPAPDASAFFGLGVEHILLGLDHVLFVICLVLLPMGWRRLAAFVTCFTAGHSITLVLATLGVVSLPPQLAEILIAFSIAYVAVENLTRARRRPPAPGSRQDRRFVVRRCLLTFAFGLVHGFGFSGVLGEIGLPAAARVASLALFNLGVEAGQLLVVATLLPALALARRFPFESRLAAPCSALIGVAGAFWMVQRAFFW